MIDKLQHHTTVSPGSCIPMQLPRHQTNSIVNILCMHNMRACLISWSPCSHAMLATLLAHCSQCAQLHPHATSATSNKLDRLSLASTVRRAYFAASNCGALALPQCWQHCSRAH